MEYTHVFLVIKKGIYIQAVNGVFDDYDNALKNAKKAIEAESDDYHTFQIYRLSFNKIIIKSGWQDLNSDHIVCNVIRTHKTIEVREI